MNMPTLEITHQDAQIEIESRRARIEINSRRPHFTMYRNSARMTLDRRLPRMHMDRSQTDLALNRGPIMLSSRQNVDIARQDASDAIGEIAAEGTEMMQIENKNVSIGAIAAQKSVPQELNINIASLPKVQIDWDPGYVNVNWTPGEMDFQWDVSSKVDIRVEPSYIEIRLARHPEVRIRVVYKNEGGAGGKIVDKYL